MKYRQCTRWLTELRLMTVRLHQLFYHRDKMPVKGITRCDLLIALKLYSLPDRH